MDTELEKIHMISNIKRLYTDSITDKDKELMMDYINNLSEKELNAFKEIYHNLTYNIYKKCNITHNSIKLTLKLYNDTGEKTFPYINVIASKGWSVGNGTFAFSLYLLNNEYYKKEIYSGYRVKYCINKKLKIDIQNVFGSINDIEITLTDNEEVKENV